MIRALKFKAFRLSNHLNPKPSTLNPYRASGGLGFGGPGVEESRLDSRSPEMLRLATHRLHSRSLFLCVFLRIL